MAYKKTRARRVKRSGHKRSGRSRKQRGTKQRGGATPYYSFGSSVAPEAPYAAKVEVHDSANITRPGFLASANAGTGGLPGFTGGGKRRRGTKRSGTKRRTQRGGRYAIDMSSGIGSTGPNVFAPVSRIACEGGYVNPLNPGPHTGSSQPTLQGGGGSQQGLLGSVDAAAYYAPTAGYSNEPSKWVSSVGTPSLLQIPYDARAMNPACLKTGGGKRRSKRSGSKRR